MIRKQTIYLAYKVYTIYQRFPIDVVHMCIMTTLVHKEPIQVIRNPNRLANIDHVATGLLGFGLALIAFSWRTPFHKDYYPRRVWPTVISRNIKTSFNHEHQFQNEQLKI